MNPAVRYILRSMVARHGTAMSQCPRLCNAYLADLLANYPQERRYLVAAVRAGLPWQSGVGAGVSSPLPELTLSGFARENHLSVEEAVWVAESWRYALHPRYEATAGSGKRRWAPVYFGGFFSGVALLVVGSSIAYYQDALVPVGPQEMAIELPATPLLTQGLTGRDRLVDNRKPALQPLPVLKVDERLQRALRQPVPVERDRPEPEDIALHQALSVPRMHEQRETEVIATNSSRSASTFPRSGNSTPHRKGTVLKPDKTPQLPPNPPQDKTASQRASVLLASIMQDSIRFGEQSNALRKKQGDMQALNELLNLTGDGFYRQPLAAVRQQIDALQQSLSHLSATYGEKLRSLCTMPEGDWQAGLRQAGSAHPLAARASSLLRQHRQNCGRKVPATVLRQQLLTAYGRP